MTVDTGTASGSMPQMTTPSLVGETIDNRYRLMKKLGEGGMGEVYAADHIHIEKRFAIKLLRPEIVSNAEAVTRFRQEARSSSSIGHRNIIAIEDFGQLPDGRIYMAMELLNGAPLNDMITQPLSPDRLLNILIQTGHGLAAAHSKNIVHRDMKPENIFVTIAPDGSDIPKILDFGIAKVSGNDGGNHLTRTGTIFGTPFYMAPEQALGNPVDQRTDIYAMGVIAYEVFAGSLPFQGESFMGILTQHITTEAEPVQARAAKVGRTLPPGLAEIISRCLRKNPAERFQTMDELVNALIAIYRQIAGAGMSTYMEAFGGQPGMPGMHPTPMPSPTGGQLVQQRNPTYPTGPNQLPPSGPLAAPTQPPYGPPGTGPHGQVGPYPTGPTPIVSPHQPKKSGAMVPIIIALVVVLLGGAGAAVYFLVLAPKAEDGPVAKNDKPDKDDPVGSDKDKPIVKDSVDAGAKDVVIDAAGSATVATDAADSQAGSDAGSGSGSNLATDAGVAEIDAGSAAPPPVEEIQVAIGANTKIDLYEDGKKVTDAADSLQMIKVPANAPRTFVVKASGFKDEKLVVDGKTPKLKVSMTRVPKPPDPNPHPPDPNHNGSDHNPLHNPDVLDCRVSVKNPHDKACVKQYCALHPKDDNCTLL